MSTHEEVMAEALVEAARGRGMVEPNPLVGALLVRDGKVISRGWHRTFGDNHAEIDALSAANGRAEGSTMYVTLEPCAHHGKTPPCADALIESGVSRVVCAMQDPNPVTSGKGYERLRFAGIEVIENILHDEAAELNAPYVKLISTGMPYVNAKWAMTLDGRIATSTGESKWISSEESRKEVHTTRGRMDAVMTGIGTVLEDDPLLSDRGIGPRTPVRIVVDSTARTPLHSRLMQTTDQGDILIATSANPDGKKVEALKNAGAHVLATSGAERTELRELLCHLGAKQMTNVMLEGGPELTGAMFEQELIDRATVYIAPMIIGGKGSPGPTGGTGADRISDALRGSDIAVRRIGGDAVLECCFRKRESR